MKKEILEVMNGPRSRQKELAAGGDSFYQGTINEYIPFIEIHCRKAVERVWGHRHEIDLENEALELSNRVLDKLQQDNYKVLRQFKGNARLSTYITAVISNQAVDLIRKKRGRSREKERAKTFGPLGEQVYDMVFVQGLALPAVYDEMKSRLDFSGSFEDLQAVVEKIKGRGRQEIQLVAAAEEMLADNRSSPEDLAIESQRQEKLAEVLKFVVSRLKGEERLILRMRFPGGIDEEPKSVGQIANLLGTSRKAVYNRIDRILKKCRDLVIQSGVGSNDLF